jgi:predicted AlkP superfamily pyrophosphatase or phosphodiesterase
VVLVTLDGFPAYALEDARLPVPELRALGQRGVMARAMRVSNPSVTWPNHTTLITGAPPARHGVLFNGLLVRTPEGGFRQDESRLQRELVHIPTLYDVAQHAGLITAEVAWVAIREAAGIRHSFPEQPTGNEPMLVELEREGIVSRADAVYDSDLADAMHDQIRARVACYLLRRRRPNLLLLHLAAVDSANHAYGPGTPASYNAMALVDSCLQRVREALDITYGREHYTIVVASDHGFQEFTHSIVLPALVKGLGFGAVCTPLPMGGAAFFYMKSKAAPERGRLAAALRNITGIAAAMEPAAFPALGLPDPANNPDMADLVAYAAPGFVFTAEDHVLLPGNENVKSATHGYAASMRSMDGIFFAAGYGIRGGITVDRIDNTDVAPTLARLLGVKLPHATGHVRQEILTAEALSAEPL